LARKILLADDSVTAQNMGRKILADAGYDIVTVNNGSAALKKITEIKPDLIVLDVYMPGYSGLEVCQRLKDAEETAHIPVLLTVGKLEPFKPEEARRVRADGHIVKPFEASELLTAITRLEDSIVPQQASGRYEGSGRKSDVKPGTDNGWKSRLGFPSKKKKEEKEEAEDFTTGTFRDFRKGKGKTGANAPAAKAAAFQEPELVPDIPRDITPEELDALSAVAAKLDGPNAATEKVAPAADRTGDAPATEVATVAAGTEVVAVAADAKQEEKTEGETPAAVEPAALAVEAPVFAVESGGEVEIPVEHMELATEAAAVVADPVAVDTVPHGTEPEGQTAEGQHSETPHSENQHLETQTSENQPAETSVVGAVVVNTALLAQEAAPVDRNDEPIFAAAASAVEAVPQENAEAKPEEAVAVAKSETTETSETAGADAVAAKELESQPQVSETQDSKAEEIPAGTDAQPVTVAANLPEMAVAEEPAPSDEELAEALRLLTPATGQPDVSIVPSHGTLVAAGQLLAEEVARNMAAGSRWVAEAAALSPEEAAISLEAEMFRTFAAMHAATAGDGMEPARITAVSAIAAAVENRLAAVELASSAGTLTERGTENSAAEQPASAEMLTAVSAEASAVVAENETEKLGDLPSAINIQATEAEKIAPEKLEAEPKDSAEKASEEAPAEEFAAATFAEAIGQSVVEQDAVEQAVVDRQVVDQHVVDQSEVGQNEVGAGAERDEEPASGTTAAAAVVEENLDSSSEVEGQEAMRKDKDGKSKKTNWHQIHSAPASAAAKGDVVEAAKETEPVAEEAPKAMAAAAASAPASAPDAGTIASIVDSVMADLRPKIVEEIAKRLAGK
jgi:CheY-like chemotaxis protein